MDAAKYEKCEVGWPSDNLYLYFIYGAGDKTQQGKENNSISLIFFAPPFLNFIIIPYLKTQHLSWLEACDQYICKWSNHRLSDLLLSWFSFVLLKILAWWPCLALHWTEEHFMYSWVACKHNAQLQELKQRVCMSVRLSVSKVGQSAEWL